MMRIPAATCLLLLLTGGFGAHMSSDDWLTAAPGWKYAFPADHFSHGDFKTEWWYFTGNLQEPDGRRFGYQITFFRQGVRPPARRGETTSRFVVHDLKFAHMAVTDRDRKRFVFDQKISRGAFGEAGFGSEDRIAWIEEWSLELREGTVFQVRANGSDAHLELTLRPAKAWVVHGENGISKKAASEGHASHYYSGTRLRTAGQLVLAGRRFAVEGESWFDHEWATNQLTPEQVGWDWFSVQLEDGTELMLYQMRLRSGGVDPASSGTWIERDGRVQHLARDAYELKPVDFWVSKATGARYPIGWEVQVRELDLQLRITTPVPGQELALKPVSYWEGMIEVEGARRGRPLRGHGYLELTGYAGELVGLSVGP